MEIAFDSFENKHFRDPDVLYPYLKELINKNYAIRNLPLTEEKISEAVNEICKIDMKDDVTFAVKSIAPIRKDDIYGGYCVRMAAVYDTILTPLSIDISTGDVITPEAVQYEFGGIFDEDIIF